MRKKRQKSIITVLVFLVTVITIAVVNSGAIPDKSPLKQVAQFVLKTANET